MRFRITQSLLADFYWVFRKEDGYESFLKTLNREPKPVTQAMLDGTRFEGVLNSVLDGEIITPDHEWYSPITEMAEELQGSQQQVMLTANTRVEGVDFVLHGILDYLRAGHIWDCKFSKRYDIGKYHWSKTPQTAMYFALVPEAFDFTYIISDGNYVYRERYPRDIVPPIEQTIKAFMEFLDKMNLVDTYCDKWDVAKYDFIKRRDIKNE